MEKSSRTNIIKTTNFNLRRDKFRYYYFKLEITGQDTGHQNSGVLWLHAMLDDNSVSRLQDTHYIYVL